MSTARPRAFLSYTLRDSLLDERKLASIKRSLQKRADVYVDALDNPSRDHQAYVIDQLQHADVLLACVTPAYLRSPWVRFELALAAESGLPIVALRMSGSNASGAALRNTNRDPAAASQLARARTQHEEVACLTSDFL